MGRRPVGLPGLTDELRLRAREWAERTCAEQELDTKISDPAKVAQVAGLLGVSSAVARRAAATATEDAREAQAA